MVLDEKDPQLGSKLMETSIWEGIGVIKFADGSTYHGMTKNQ